MERCMVSRFGWRVCFPLVWLCVASAAPRESAAQPTTVRNALTAVQEKHREHFQEFVGELEKLVEFCQSKNLSEGVDQIQGRLTESRLVSPDAPSLKRPALPRDVQPEIPNDLTADERYWQTQLRKQDTDYAKKLYLLSRQSLNNGNPSFAYRLVREAAVHDSDHPQIRKILGYVRSGNEWVTPFAAEMIKKQNVWHEEFGWLPKSHLVRYAAGERNFKGRWVTTAKEDVLRQSFADGWEIRTDHYLIKTNYSLERGVELGKALEDYHEYFNETFAGFFNTPEQLKKLFEGAAKSVRLDAKQYVVHYYRTREEYLDRLKKEFPNIAQTNGVYMTNDRVAHFYHDPNAQHEATLFHEATHQLFFESHNKERPIGDKAHFWIIEGIACYMESFHCRNGVVSVGDPQYIRFAGARANLLAEKYYYVPLREFSGLGMKDFQNAPQPELMKNYTQASGLARFFMHYDKGRYREALVTHLSQLYSVNSNVRDQTKGLDILTGVAFEDLDRQYLEDARAVEQAAAR